MDDLISRQAAIDVYGDWYVEEGTADGFIGTVKQLLEGLPPVQPEQIWIPCSERLPEKGGRYLCCWQGKTVDTGMFLNGHFRLYGEIKDHLITAWMPLPKPYAERRTDDK